MDCPAEKGDGELKPGTLVDVTRETPRTALARHLQSDH